MLHLSQIILGILLAAIITLLAWQMGALSVSGAVAAWTVGAIVFGFGGWASALPLLLFFGTSTALSRWRRRFKETLGYEKSGRRDAGQVLANGGIAAGCILLPFLFPRFGGAHAHLLFLAALAAANADTWATEIGSALGGQPYDLRTGRSARPGTSGAVSLGGTLAALAGAALIGCFASDWLSRGVVTAAGLTGALFDSVLGATAQAQWRDPNHPERFTEHSQPGPPVHGWRAMTNDAVNFLCSLVATCLLEMFHKIY